MKKTFKLLSCCFILLALASCGSVSLAEKGSVDQGEMKINPKSVIGYVGDVMPFYDNGVMNIFYLQDGIKMTGYHPFALMTTTDYVNYTDYGEVIPYVNNLTSPDLALGTGSVIKDENGLYHCFYTGHNDYKNSELPYFEKIQHATSTDKINWTKIPEDGFYGGENDFRDPYVYKFEDGLYHMLITTRKNGTGVIKEYTSSNLKTWKDKGVFFSNDSGTYNMECPTFIKYNGYYYLSYSEQGGNRVTHYRYKKNLNDEWIKPTNDFLDSEGLYAGRMEKDETKMYLFGWVPVKTGGWDKGEYDWGGNLVCHELSQNFDGTLNAKMVSKIKEALNHEVSYQLSNGKDLSKMSFDDTSDKAYMVEKLSRNITRISYEVELGKLGGKFGLSFDTQGNHTLSNLVICFDTKTNFVNFYNEATGFDNLGKVQTYVPYKFEENSKINVDIVIDNQIITVYINEKIALTNRLYYMPEASFSFYGSKANIRINNIKFFE